MGILLLCGAVALTLVVGVAWSRGQGVVRGPRAAGAALPADWLPPGVDLGSRATFVQFSAQVCSACRATDRVLREVADRSDGVVHHELDVEDHLALTGRLGILHTPTVLLLDPAGVEVARMSGAVTPARAREALGRTSGADGEPAPRGAAPAVSSATATRTTTDVGTGTTTDAGTADVTKGMAV